MKRTLKASASSGANRASTQNRESTPKRLRRALEVLLKDSEARISIAAVAREAGVSPALIHNSYPDFAEQVRRATGRAARAQRDEKNQLLIVEREKNRELRKERDALLLEVKDLASVNEALRRELDVQTAIAAGSVTRLRRSQ